MSVVCCQIDVCVGLITHPEKSCGVSDCDREALIMRRPCGLLGAVAPWGETVFFFRTAVGFISSVNQQ